MMMQTTISLHQLWKTMRMRGQIGCKGTLRCHHPSILEETIKILNKRTRMPRTLSLQFQNHRFRRDLYSRTQLIIPTPMQRKTLCSHHASVRVRWRLFTISVWNNGDAALGTLRHDRVCSARLATNPMHSLHHRHALQMCFRWKTKIGWKQCRLMSWQLCGNLTCGGNLEQRLCAGDGFGPWPRSSCHPLWHCIVVPGVF